MKSALYELTLNIMMRMISGKRYFGGDIVEVEEEGRRFRKILDEAFSLAGASNLGDYLPILSWFGVKGLEKKLLLLREKKDVFFQGLIEQLREKHVNEEKNNNKKKKTMIEVLFSLQESDPEYYTEARGYGAHPLLEDDPPRRRHIIVLPRMVHPTKLEGMGG
ncbi:putative isoflavone 3'-hydroxylase [Helianthus debilis subsp. tardiflorus]